MQQHHEKVVTFDSSQRRGDNAGIILPDENGYYKTNIGGLDVMCESGNYWPVKNVDKLFGEGSELKRRLDEGDLYCEVNHPPFKRGMSKDEYFEALSTPHTKWFCGFWGSITLNYDIAKTLPHVPDNVVVIQGEIKPFGPHAEMLRSGFSDPKQNMCFSVRGFTYNMLITGTTREYRELYDIRTFDWVPSPGTAIANKWDSPAAQSRPVHFTKEDVTHLYTKLDLVEGSAQAATQASRSAVAKALSLFDELADKPDFHDPQALLDSSLFKL